MICRFFILSIVFLGVGFGPALAQELFLRKDDGSAKDGKPTLYMKPRESGFTDQTEHFAVKYKDKLKLQQQKGNTKVLISSFEEMQELGFKPRNAKEIDAYGRMHRALSQNIMYKRREALIAHLEKQEREVEAMLARRDAGALKVDDQKDSATVSKETSEDAQGGHDTQTTKILKKPRVYVKKTADEKARPTKVFKDY